MPIGRLLWVRIIVVAGIVLAPAIGSAADDRPFTNLLANPYFEGEANSIPWGWNRAAGILGTDIFFMPREGEKEGNMVFVNQREQSPVSLRSEPIPVIKGARYQASAWIRTAPTAAPLIVIEFLDGSGNHIRDADGPSRRAQSAEWELITVSAEAPPNAESVRLQIRATATSSGVAHYGEIYYSDPSLHALVPRF